MLDVAGSQRDHPFGAVVAVHEGAQLLRREGFHGLGRAEDRASDRLVAEGGFGEMVEDDVVGRVVRGADLLQDHVLFALELVGIELGVRQDVGKDVDGKRHVVAEHAGVEGRRLDAGRGVDLAADILDFRGDFPGAAPCVPLNAICSSRWAIPCSSSRFVSGPRLDPDAQGDGFEIGNGFGSDCQAVGKTADLNNHVRLNSLTHRPRVTA